MGQQGQEAVDTEYTCYCDGSWKEQWNGGVGYIIRRGHELVVYRSAKVLAACPLQAEAMAVNEAIKHATSLGITSCNFLTDNLYISQACSKVQPPMDSEWKAFREVFEVWKTLKDKTEFTCMHVVRSLNDEADNLARMGRKQGWDFEGYTLPMFSKVD